MTQMANQTTSLANLIAHRPYSAVITYLVKKISFAQETEALEKSIPI
jgi:hypothetical protein